MGWSDLDWSKPNVLDYRYTSQIHEAIMERAHVSRTAISKHYPPDAYSPPNLHFMKWIRSSIEKLCVNFYAISGEVHKWTIQELYSVPERNLAFTPDNQDFFMLWNSWMIKAKNCLDVLMYTMPYREPEGNNLYASTGWPPYEEDGVKYNYFTTSEDVVNAALIESVISTPVSYGVHETEWGFRGENRQWLGSSDIAYQAHFNVTSDIVVHNDFAFTCILFVCASKLHYAEFDLCGSDWTKTGTFLSSLNAGDSATIESVTPSDRVPDVVPVLTPPLGEIETENRGFALNTLFYWGCEGGFKYYEDEEEE
jgi:hypothetical protein